MSAAAPRSWFSLQVFYFLDHWFPPGYSCLLFLSLGFCIFPTPPLHRGTHTCPQPGCGAAIIALDSVQGHQQGCAPGKKNSFFLKIPNTTELAVHRSCRSIWLRKMGLSSCQAYPDYKPQPFPEPLTSRSCFCCRTNSKASLYSENIRSYSLGLKTRKLQTEALVTVSG